MGLMSPNVGVEAPGADWRLGRETDDRQHGFAARAPSLGWWASSEELGLPGEVCE